MDCIVHVTPGWGIGWGGQLQLRLHEDMRRFRSLTEGKTLVLGRKTLATFPGGRPLPRRRNLVLSRSAREIPGAECLPSLPALLSRLEELEGEEIMVIGGETVYRALLPRCERAYVTKSFRPFPADAWFPDLDADPRWTLEEAGELQEENGIPFQFLTYRNSVPQT